MFFFGDRSTIAVLSLVVSANPHSLTSWPDRHSACALISSCHLNVYTIYAWLLASCLGFGCLLIEVYNSPAANPNSCARSASPDARPTNRAHQQIDLGNGLKIKDQQIPGLEQELEASPTPNGSCAILRKEVHFDPHDIGYVLETFVIPYILNTDTQQYLEQMCWASATLEDFTRALSLLAKLPKLVKSKIYDRRL